MCYNWDSGWTKNQKCEIYLSCSNAVLYGLHKGGSTVQHAHQVIIIGIVKAVLDGPGEGCDIIQNALQVGIIGIESSK